MDDVIKRADDVVKALSETVLSGAPSWNRVPANPSGAEAVEVITALRARLEAVTQERDAAMRSVDENWITHQTVADALARAEKADDLVEALEGLMAHMPDYADTSWINAAAALARSDTRQDTGTNRQPERP